MIVLLVVIALALAMLLYEQLRPARAWPATRSWWPRALAINAFQVAIVFVAGATWERWLHGTSLLAVADRASWPVELALGYAAYVVWLYWTHRARHHVGFLWRWLHQLHHSPARIEILTSFYKHPLEIVLESILSAALLYVVLGISREAAFLATNISGVLSLFYHWNIATPRWLGYIVQRPESHCVHHQEGVHAYNYSELPVLDLLFGTFRNPARFDGTCGFGAERERRLGALLLGRDATEL
jgi:sterol desaturase/sphingolipid hydroxylase (fatty acid hydroxylase superfamily)